ncbi:hypothetical protein Tco_0003303 [Tanacetum coccineum]
MTTARTRAVVNTGKGKMDTDLKKSRWVWRPKGNYLDHVSKDSGSFMLKKGNPEIFLQDHAVTTQAAQIKDLKSQIKQLKKKAKPVISHHNAWIKSVSMKKRLARKKSLKKKLMQKESVSKQGRKPAKSEPTVHKDPAFDDILSFSGDTVVLEEKESAEKGVSTEDPVNTAQPKVSTDKPKVSTDKDDEGTTADKILAEKLQEEEREKSLPLRKELSFFMIPLLYKEDLLLNKDMRLSENKFLQEIQLRNQMMDILKHVGGYKTCSVKQKEVEDIQVMYEKVKRGNERFIPIGSAEDEKLIEKMNKKAVGMDKEEVAKELESSKVEGPKENIRKRSGRRLKMKAPKRSKRQKTDSDHEEENQLRIFIKDIFRADGSSRWIKTFSEMINLFDRMDLIEIHSLVMKRFKTTPPEGIDLLLWGDLRTIFIVHVLRLEDGTEINMLAERRYPLTKNTLERMMDLRLTAVSDDDTVFDLLRFIEKQIDEFGGQDGSEKNL